MKRQSGVALIQVLLVFAILMTLAIQLTYRQQLSISGTRHVLDSGQARAWLLSVEALGRAELQRDLDTPLLPEDWGEWSDPFDLEPGEAVFRLTPLEARYNLNWLHADSGVDEASEQVQRLLSEHGQDSGWLQRLADWFDPDSGAEFEYRLVEPGYRPPFYPIADASELRLLMPQQQPLPELDIEGWGTFLPPTSRIDLNLVSEPVLRALHPDIGEDQWLALERAREDGLEEVDDWLTREAMEILSDELPEGWFTVQGAYFLLEARVEYLEQTLSLTSWLWRSTDGSVEVYQRNYLPVDGPAVDSGDPDDDNDNPDN
ncbi:MAG: type II secretion system minor pseudopilin GspK [Natronospirillum sp.]|uniref:type II secretion system minor pseudopilin GspK n=1 Tax=Natronospirillum sp. TaxID=2812955 RepID=UPI0025EEBD25|nr:type II secretion system minor pseudopilin GspK [Natronospirillum sp.]MCH8551041.1 type II secretion system minor pseudopilin GspK [Natronospirillum sp.]